MRLLKLQITNFKSHVNSSFEFDKRINVFIGKNGVGKTNILDAIYYLSVFKSFINPLDSQLVNLNSDFFRIEGNYENDYRVVSKYGLKKKTIEINESKVLKYSQSFGHIPLVISCPSDIFLFFGGSEERRKWIDYTISIYNRSYLEALNLYNSYLEQRNAHLKNEEIIDLNLISLYNEKLDLYGVEIFEKRNELMEEYSLCIDSWYRKISNQDENIRLTYESQLLDDRLDLLLKNSLEKDKILKRTTKGIHRDDISITMSDMDIKKIASQGQQKSLLYAIRFAQAELISKKLEKQVIFLLDDFSDKLDASRMKNLLDIIPDSDFISQWFVTDTKGESLGEMKEISTFEIVNTRLKSK